MYTNKDPEKDSENEDKWDEKTDELKKVEDNLLDGDQRTYNWDSKISFEWYDFQDDKSDFYSQLVKLCEKSDSNANGDKKAADKKIENAEKVEAEAKKSLEGDETTDARDITSGLANQLKKPASSAEVPDVSDCFSGGASFASLGNGAVGKFLLTTYNFGMFSSRVSGIEKPEEDEDDSGSNVQVYKASQTVSESDCTEFSFSDGTVGFTLPADVPDSAYTVYVNESAEYDKLSEYTAESQARYGECGEGYYVYFSHDGDFAVIIFDSEYFDLEALRAVAESITYMEK